MAHQRLGVDTGQLLFAHGKRHHGNRLGGHALIAQFLVEGDVGITIDGGNHGGISYRAVPNFLMSATMDCQSEWPKGV